MSDTKLDLFPVGAGKLIPADHAGPASYTAAGETLGSSNNQTGITTLGLATIDAVLASELSVSGNYSVQAQPVGTGSRKTYKLLWYNVPATPAGVPLGLGAATAASTVSAVVSKVGTVTVANSFAANNFVLLAAFTQLGALNGTIVKLATATATGVTFNLGTAANVSSGADVTGTLQLVQAGAGNPVRLGATSTITNSIGTASLLTMTSALNPPVGSFVYIDNLVNGATANGVVVEVATSSATSFTAKWVGTGNTFSTGADTGNVWQLVTNGGALVTTGVVASITNSVATASSAGTAGVISLSAVQQFAPGNIGVLQGLTNGAVSNGAVAPVIATSLTNALFKINAQTGAYSTGADAGTFALLTTGAPSGAGDVTAGTNLSGETVRLVYVGR